MILVSRAPKGHEDQSDSDQMAFRGRRRTRSVQGGRPQKRVYRFDSDEQDSSDEPLILHVEERSGKTETIKPKSAHTEIKYA